MASRDEIGKAQNCPPEKETTCEADRIIETREEIEFLREQIESLQLELRCKEWEIQQLEQELEDTNRDLCEALKSQQETFAEAVELAKTLVERDLPPKQALADLLSVIFGLSVQPWQLLGARGAPVTLSPLSQTDRRDLVAEVDKFKANADKLKSGLFLLRERLVKLKHDCRQFNIKRHIPQPPASLDELGNAGENADKKGV